MKQTLTLLLLAILIASCSSDSSSSNNTDPYITITRNGETLTNDLLAYASLEYYDCADNNLDITATWNISYIETSEFDFSLGIVLPSFQSDLEGLDFFNSGIYIGSSTVGCMDNLDFLPDYSESGKNLSLDLSANNYSKIESITKVSESQGYVVHAVKGNYQLTYTDGGGYSVTIKGNYVLHVEAYK